MAAPRRGYLPASGPTDRPPEDSVLRVSKCSRRTADCGREKADGRREEADGGRTEIFLLKIRILRPLKCKQWNFRKHVQVGGGEPWPGTEPGTSRLPTPRLRRRTRNLKMPANKYAINWLAGDLDLRDLTGDLDLDLGDDVWALPSKYFSPAGSGTKFTASLPYFSDGAKLPSHDVAGDWKQLSTLQHSFKFLELECLSRKDLCLRFSVIYLIVFLSTKINRFERSRPCFYLGEAWGSILFRTRRMFFK
ncbi:unnamed protein product [Nesidiocoris tenuis]|uniref:Uncharacterized protein n=1 Tax=Nesidiocoris tenuis TaxID=355587 RepID=A0A6H5HDQ7_9HEMI|nr:unnamed protein product [Nesidiocoris tenuis]